LEVSNEGQHKMRVFIYEYTCARARGKAAPSLQTEGWAMLAAVHEDFARIPGVAPLTLLDADCPGPAGGQCLRLRRGEDEGDAFRALARAADFSLVIAPEFDDLLATRSQWVEDVGGRLLGCSPAAVRFTGDKLTLGNNLQARGVPTPLCQLWGLGNPIPADGYPAVWKPRHGAGSQATFLVPDADALGPCAALAQAEGTEGAGLLQPFIEGRPVSVAFLLGPKNWLALPPAVQHLSTDGRFHYLGGMVPLPSPLAERASSLAFQAVSPIPGLRGYVGVDLVLGDAPDGGNDCVIEINPRLTTSYVGLRVLAEMNLAEALLAIVDGDIPFDLAWKPFQVLFGVDGQVSVSQALPHGP
jgi:predicted ATP-grasp superfamily ATP-dependent carboligase